MDQCEPLPVRPLPDELKALRHWVVWHAEVRPGKRKPAKAPYQPRTGHRARIDVPATWGTYSQALARYRQGGWQGLGFVFTAGDPYCGVDVDDCRVPLTGEITPWAWEIVETLHSYTEVSPSGLGLHVLVRASLPGDAGRYFAVTGKRLAELPSIIEERQAQVEALYVTLAPAETTIVPLAAHPGAALARSDAEVLVRALAAVNGAKFQALWSGQLAAYRNPKRARSIRAGRTLRCVASWPIGPRTMPTKWTASFASRRFTARIGSARWRGPYLWRGHDLACDREAAGKEGAMNGSYGKSGPNVLVQTSPHDEKALSPAGVLANSCAVEWSRNSCGAGGSYRWQTLFPRRGEKRSGRDGGTTPGSSQECTRPSCAPVIPPARVPPPRDG